MGNTYTKQSPNQNQNFTCEICTETKTIVHKFDSNRRKCNHPFCTRCMLIYIKLKLQDESSTAIKCPALTCRANIDLNRCRSMIPRRVFNKWCDNLSEAYVLQFDRCYCPYVDCSALIVNECRGISKNDTSASKCPSCKRLLCFDCKTIWHQGYGCDQREEYRDRNDDVFGQIFERKKWTRCPVCGQCVERIYGCSVMYCRCKTRFCYNCGKRLKLYYMHRCGEGNQGDRDMEFICFAFLGSLFLLFISFIITSCTL